MCLVTSQGTTVISFAKEISSLSPDVCTGSHTQGPKGGDMHACVTLNIYCIVIVLCSTGVHIDNEKYGSTN